MTEYIETKEKHENGYEYGTNRWFDRDNPEVPKPDSLRVTLRSLGIGDIVLIRDYRAGIIRSAVITAIEKSKNSESHKDVTTVDAKGKIDVWDCMPHSRIYHFERQCSQEQRENVEERSRNIALRRDIQRLEGKVEDLVKSMEWFGQYGGKNPKMPTYLQQVKQFAADLATMYDDVGNDLGLPIREQRKKKREEE